jgi:hypothetical protein
MYYIFQKAPSHSFLSLVTSVNLLYNTGTYIVSNLHLSAQSELFFRILLKNTLCAIESAAYRNLLVLT